MLPSKDSQRQEQQQTLFSAAEDTCNMCLLFIMPASGKSTEGQLTQ